MSHQRTVKQKRHYPLAFIIYHLHHAICNNLLENVYVLSMVVGGISKYLQTLNEVVSDDNDL